MHRSEILVHSHIRQQLGDDIISKCSATLPAATATCNRPLGLEPVALEAEQLGRWCSSDFTTHAVAQPPGSPAVRPSAAATTL
jgi:hypothetical protein